ncbi:hypothetical protein E4198_18445 [Streptomyces sp. RKND-216]|nr:hypothetical protein E4198_18445 [Streptomyces sp. RKND-216]
MSGFVDDRVTAVIPARPCGNRTIMTYDIPLTPRPFHELNRLDRLGHSGSHADGPAGGSPARVLTASMLRAHGVGAAEASEHCRPGGPWRMLLPGVFLLHPGPPTSEDRLHAALLHTLRRQTIPTQSGHGPAVRTTPHGIDAMITGPAALALRGFTSARPLPALDRIDVLVPATRRLRSAGFARVVRGGDLPEPEQIAGLPVAPVERALADTVADLDDAETVGRLLTEAVRDGHCEAQTLMRELEAARLLTAPHVADAVDRIVAEGRTVAEARLYDLVRTQGVPDPCWNVDLRLPGGPHLGGVDAYWPDEAVALSIDARTHRHIPGDEGGTEGLWDAYAQQRESLERLGITVVHLTPRALREAPELQAAVVRTALMAAEDREPAAYVLVLPR